METPIPVGGVARGRLLSDVQVSVGTTHAGEPLCNPARRRADPLLGSHQDRDDELRPGRLDRPAQRQGVDRVHHRRTQRLEPAPTRWYGTLSTDP